MPNGFPADPDALRQVVADNFQLDLPALDAQALHDSLQATGNIQPAQLQGWKRCDQQPTGDDGPWVTYSLPRAALPALHAFLDRDRQQPDHGWYLPATILNIFWGDALPRYLAKLWREGTPPPPDGTDIWCQVIGSLDTLSQNATGEFRRRAIVLRGYSASNYPRPKFIFRAGGGFDFVLSNLGVEVFFPPEPPTDSDAFRKMMARYYATRSTGRAAIVLPGFMPPTGTPELGLGELMARAITGGFSPGDFIRAGSSMPAMDGASQALLPLVDLGAGARSWVISGAVYRAITDLLPRIVAEIWARDLAGQNGAAHWKWNSSYDTGLRNEIGLVLETDLPGQAQMHVFRGTTSADPPLPWGPDLVVTRAGFHFPAPGTPPSRDTMLAGMVSGRVGNPIFTASSQTS